MSDETTEVQDPEAEQKKRYRFYAIIASGVLFTMIVGGVLYGQLGGSEQPSATPSADYNSGTGGASQPGSVQVAPNPIQLIRQPDNTYSGTVTVTAVAKPFTVAKVSIEGDPRMALDNPCMITSRTMQPGEACTLTIKFNPAAPLPNAQAQQGQPQQQGYPAAAPFASASYGAPAAAPAVPQFTVGTGTLRITGSTKTAGGRDQAIGPGITITLSDGAAPAGQMPPQYGQGGIPQGYPPGAPATAGIEPYGPVQANTQVGPLQPGAGGAAPIPVQANSQGEPYQAPAPTMSLRDQYILARRQAAFTGAQPRTGQVSGQVQRGGSWSDIKVPSATSSAPQDMSRILTMDRVITAVLVRTFDNRSSQQVIAQVDRNVYGASGRNILIPRGSTVIGQMTSGADRAVVNWTQLIRPDGARFVMKASGGDAMGQSGVPGRTDNRFGKRYGSVLLGTLLKAGVAIGTKAASTESAGGIGGVGATTAQNNGAIVTGIVSQDLNSIIQQIIAKSGNIQPVTVVPAGTRVTIFPQQDLVMFAQERETIVRTAYPRPMNAGAGGTSFVPSAGDSEQSAPGQGGSGRGNVSAGSGRVSNGRPSMPRNIDPNNTSLGNTPPWGR